MRSRKHIAAMVLASLLLITGCEPKPQPIDLGGDQCNYCRMIITEGEFASQAVNHQGRAYTFDSIECMAAFDLTNDDPENIHSKWVPDFHDRENWLNSDSAFYLKSETLRSPMGLYLTAYSTREVAEQMKAEYGGEIISYDRVKELVEQAWLSDENANLHGH